MLVSAKEMLTKAREGKYAVGQFNINNLEWTKTILLTAQELNSPVILGVSEGAGKYMGGFKTVSGMVNGLLEGLNITVPVALHLDHGTYEGCYKCIEAGFSSIMFDGSHYPIAENVEKTTELVMKRDFPLKRKSVQSAVKKTVLSAWVSVLTRMNASQLQTLVLQCLLPESVTSTANILPTGRVLALRHWLP